MGKRLGSLLAWNIVLLCCVALLSAGCASTQLDSSWHATQPDMTGFKKVLVVGTAKDPGRRRIFEDSFVTQANAQGFAAVQSYLSIPQGGQIPPELMQQTLKQTGCDAVMVTRLQRYDQSTVVTGPAYAGPAGGWGPYRGAWSGAYEPPQAHEQISVILSVSVYSGSDGQLAWSGTTSTVDPAGLETELKKFGQVIIGQMAKDGTIVATLPIPGK